MTLRAIGVLLLAVLATSVGMLASAPAASADAGVREIPVAFANGDVRLSGTLLLPVGDGPFPAVVLAHGSAAESRALYLVDALMFANHGIAAFAFDKRGTGASSGDLGLATIDDLAGDLRAAVTAVGDRPEVSEVGLLGVSQGAWLAPFVASTAPDVAFIVQVTGSATSLGAQNLFDAGRQFERAGFEERDIARYVRAERMLYSLRGAIDSGWLPLPRYWFVSLDPFADPAERWPHVEAPALVLFGSEDDLVPTATSLALLRDGDGLLQHPWSRVVVLDGYHHALGGPARNEDARYVELVTGWVSSVVADIEPPPVDANPAVPAAPAWFTAAARPPWWGSGPVHLGLIGLLLAVSSALAVAAAFSRSPRRVRIAVQMQSGLILATAGGVVFVLQWVLAAEGANPAPPVPLAGAVRPLAALSTLFAGGLAIVAIRAAGRGRRHARLPGKRRCRRPAVGGVRRVLGAARYAPLVAWPRPGADDADGRAYPVRCWIA